MIVPKYEKMYDKFIKYYEANHVCPWHELSKDQLDYLYYGYTCNNDVIDDYSYYYMMQYLIKRLSGKNDSHTVVSFRRTPWIPFVFKVIENQIYVIGSKDEETMLTRLTSINGVDINKITNEIENIVSYGSQGWFEYNLANILSSQNVLLSLPSLQGSTKFVYELVDENNNVYYRERSIYEPIQERRISYKKNIPAKHDNLYYETNGDAIIFTYNSCINQKCERMNEVLNELDIKLLSGNYNRFIIDLRNNSGGNSNNNTPILEFLKKHDELDIITLINNCTFSSGRFMLMGLQDLGTITIGEEPGTPINCFGNKKTMETEEDELRTKLGEEPEQHDFFHSCSSKYFYFDEDYQLHQAKTKEDYDNMSNQQKATDFQSPDIEMKPTLDDYKNNRDSVLEFALNYKRERVK